MTDNAKTAVTDRFFIAFDALIESGETLTQTFCREMSVDKRNFAKQRDDHSRQILKPFWLTFIVERFNVSAYWLLTGHGRMCTR